MGRTPPNLHWTPSWSLPGLGVRVGHFSLSSPPTLCTQSQARQPAMTPPWLTSWLRREWGEWGPSSRPPASCAGSGSGGRSP